MNKETLQNYIKEIDANRYLNSEKMLKVCKALMREAKKDKDDKALVYGEYFTLEANYRLGTLNEKMLSRAIHALQLAKRYKMFELEAKITNMIGIFFLNQGDNISALEYYQMAMELAKKHRFANMVRVLTNNIGDLYMQLQQYEEALDYLNDCFRQCKVLLEAGREDIRALNLNITLINMAECYYALGDYEKSLETINSLYPEDSEIEASYYGPSKAALLALTYAKLGRFDEAEEYLETTIAAAEAQNEIIEMSKDYVRICQVLIAHRDFDKAYRMQQALAEIAKKLDFSSVWCDYYETMIDFAKKLQDTDNLLLAYEKFICAKKKQDKFQQEQQLRALKTRQALNLAIKKQKKAEEAKASFQKQSEHDALTGLYNRYALNRECERLCRIAREKDETIGIIVMDIDYFKQYNDTYGHLTGDTGICEVSNTISKAVGDSGMVARYGGDEFFVLTYGFTTERMVELAKHINALLREKELKHEKSLVSRYVTVSQGIANGVPEPGQTVMELIHLADTALYHAKEAKRSSIGVYQKNKYKVIYNETLVD